MGLLDKLTPPESVVETETVYKITATFTFTGDDLDDEEVRAFFDLIAKQEDAEVEEEETEVNNQHSFS